MDRLQRLQQVRSASRAPLSNAEGGEEQKEGNEGRRAGRTPSPSLSFPDLTALRSGVCPSRDTHVYTRAHTGAHSQLPAERRAREKRTRKAAKFFAPLWSFVVWLLPLLSSCACAPALCRSALCRSASRAALPCLALSLSAALLWPISALASFPVARLLLFSPPLAAFALFASFALLLGRALSSVCLFFLSHPVPCLSHLSSLFFSLSLAVLPVFPHLHLLPEFPFSRPSSYVCVCVCVCVLPHAPLYLDSSLAPRVPALPLFIHLPSHITLASLSSQYAAPADPLAFHPHPHPHPHRHPHRQPVPACGGERHGR